MSQQNNNIVTYLIHYNSQSNQCSSFFAVLLCLVALYFIVRYHWRKEEEETHQMYRYVEKIIGTTCSGFSQFDRTTATVACHSRLGKYIIECQCFICLA